MFKFCPSYKRLSFGMEIVDCEADFIFNPVRVMLALFFFPAIVVIVAFGNLMWLFESLFFKSTLLTRILILGEALSSLPFRVAFKSTSPERISFSLRIFELPVES